MNSVCTVAVGELAETGSSTLAWLVAAAGLVMLGALVLVMWRMRRARPAAAALLLVGLVALAVAGPQPAAPAQAAASDVVYSAGCSLIEVDEAGVLLHPVTSTLLPGDSVIAITAPVASAFAGEIELSGEAVLGTGLLAAQLVTEVRFDGAAGPVTLAAGESVVVTVVVALSPHADDTVQGQAVDVELVLTASEA
jgi:LPXTG-motif cell wall-anchored protein